jgi:hypothetical protein
MSNPSPNPPGSRPVAIPAAPKGESFFSRAWKWVKAPWDVIKVCKTLAGLVSGAMVILNIAVAGSTALRAFIFVFGVLGAVAGFFIPAKMWNDTPLPSRRRLAWGFIVVWFLTLFINIVFLTALDASVSRDYETLGKFHDLLVDFIIPTYFALGLLFLSNFFCLVGTFTVLWLP